MKTFFLRCDDVVRPDRAFLRVFKLLSGLGLPLSCAVIPAGAGKRLAAFFRRQRALGARVEALQHGLSHAEHAGNRYLKQEFGPARSYAEQAADLAEGKKLLARLLGRTPPVFVPPFHAYNSDTLRALRALGFRALSASRRPERLPRGLVFLPTRVTVNEYDLRLRARPLDLRVLQTRTLAAIKEKGPAGIYFHHADLDDKNFRVFSAYAAFLTELACRGLARFALCSELLKRSAR